MLSHELRTPLTPVLASALAWNIRRLRRKTCRSRCKSSGATSSWKRDLIDDLLDLTRISKGKVQLNFEIVDAHTLLRNAHRDLPRRHRTKTSQSSTRSRRAESSSPGRPGARAANFLEPDQERGEIYAAERRRFLFPRATMLMVSCGSK